MKKLVLFDIDGTLIDSGKAGSRALNRVFHELFGVTEAFAGIRLAGKTDMQIIKEGLSAWGLNREDGMVSRIIAGYLASLRVEILNKEKYIHPGVLDLLDNLAGMGDRFALGLLTGNIEPGARIKLGAFDLNRYFSFGAFGSDHEDRTRLLDVAMKRYQERTGTPVENRDCIVIGDTPKDVECSKPFGAVSIAVATGPYPYESLLETEADHVLRDLTEAMAIIHPR